MQSGAWFTKSIHLLEIMTLKHNFIPFLAFGVHASFFGSFFGQTISVLHCWGFKYHQNINLFGDFGSTYAPNSLIMNTLTLRCQCQDQARIRQFKFSVNTVECMVTKLSITLNSFRTDSTVVSCILIR